MGDSMSTIINATTTNGVVIQPDNSGSLVLQTNSGTTALTIDTSQNVAIGASSAINSGTRVTVNGTNQIVDSFGNMYVGTTNSQAINLGGQITIGGSWSGTSQTVFGAIAGRKQSSTNAEAKGYLQFSTLENSVQERMRIDSSGNVLVGTTTQGSTARLTIKAADTGFGGIAVVQFGSSVYWTQNIDSLDGYTWAKNGSDFWFAGRSGSNNCVSASGSWVNSSDSRLKTNVKTISNALENVCNLRGVSFNRISNNSSEIGLIAQEVLEIYPDAVEKPSTDKDFYGLNYGALVAPLIEAIKEQQTIINNLKARIETLEAK